MKRLALAVPAAALLVVPLAGPASAAPPHPSERAVNNERQQGCVNVLAHNPNALVLGPNSGTPGYEELLPRRHDILCRAARAVLIGLGDAGAWR